MKENHLIAHSPYCGQDGAWTMLEGRDELLAELNRLAAVKISTATGRDPHGKLCEASEGRGSDFIIQVIRDIQASGQYPYNRTVQCEVERRLGIEKQPDNASPLSWLVYRSQSLAEYLSKLEDGWTMATDKLLTELQSRRASIQMIGETVLGMEAKSRGLRLVKNSNGRWFGMPPRARSRGFSLEGKWVREHKSKS